MSSIGKSIKFILILLFPVLLVVLDGVFDSLD